ASSPAIGIDWAKWLVATWALGAVAGLLRLGIHYVRLLRGLGKAPAAWATMLAEAAPSLDIRRVRAHASGPAVLWALPHALILLPPDFAERFRNAATCELVLRHEFTHVRRGDALWTIAMELVSALLWFHPLAWVGRARFRLDQELACDAASLRASPELNASYARALLDSVAVEPAPALIPWLAEPQLKERIAMIARIPPGPLRRRAGFLVVAALLFGALFGASGAAAEGTALPLKATSSAAPNTSKRSNGFIAIRTPTPGTPLMSPPTVDITYKNRNPPHYPIEALHKGEQGTVLLYITVDATGKVTDVTVDPKRTTAPAILQTAAMQAAGNWRFNPGRKNGHVVGGRITVPVTFSLHGWRPPHSSSCPEGFRYESGPGKSYSCIAPSSARSPS
ncbi:MAG TPA: M56 family metallopeptidase, partial [Rhodanobacteraceae bacterium]|nr:M56 family metallopeptidase [Rhodanobacteraceae bacterium]